MMQPIVKLGGSRQTKPKSHDKHKERAFVAASRRTDRSIEARLQSARKASEIHKKRTGKAFRISEAIIMNEEMYEEDDDYVPSRYHLPGQMVSAPASMKPRADAHRKDYTGMSDSVTEKVRRESEVTEAFARLFPEIDQSLSQPWSTHSFLDYWHKIQSDSSNSEPFSGNQASSQEILGKPLTGPIPGNDNQFDLLPISRPEATGTEPLQDELNALESMQPLPCMDFIPKGGSFASELASEEGDMLMEDIDPETLFNTSIFSNRFLENYNPGLGFMSTKTEQDEGCDSGYDGFNPTGDSASQSESCIDDAHWAQLFGVISEGQED